MHTHTNTTAHTKRQEGDQHKQIPITTGSAAQQPGHWMSLSLITFFFFVSLYFYFHLCGDQCECCGVRTCWGQKGRGGPSSHLQRAVGALRLGLKV